MITGIYKIRNIVNNKIYIGSAVDIKKRWRDHKWYLKENKHHNSHLQSSYNKYGLKNFEFIVESECEIINLLTEERKLILKYNANNNQFGYNVNDPENIFLGRNHSDETKKKLSLQKMGKKNPMYGKTGKQHPKFGMKLSVEARKRISDGHKGIPNGRNGSKSPVSKLTEENVIDIRNTYSEKLMNQRELSEKYGVLPSTINLIINRKRWTHI
jgi:group I intron endonuclease